MLLEAETVTVKTRYGEVAVEHESLLSFPLGLIGFGDCHSFALIDLPADGGRSFKLLQCLDQPDLSFTVVPASAAARFAAGDLAEAAAHHEIAGAALAVLLIVTAHRGAEGLELTANLRAPILLDTARRQGFQHVMPSEMYPLRHRLA